MASPVSISLEGIGGLISGVGSAAKDIRAAITGKSVIDATAQAQIDAKLIELEMASANAQVELNKVEAASPKLFTSGWRPAIGWICAMAMLYHFVARPLVVGFFPSLTLPALDMGELWPLVTAMLGLVGVRGYEKSKGVARS